MTPRHKKKHSFNFSGNRVFDNLSQIVHSNYWITPYYILGRVKITWCSKSYLPAVLSHSYGSYKPNETNIRAMWLFFEVALELGNFPQNVLWQSYQKTKWLGLHQMISKSNFKATFFFQHWKSEKIIWPQNVIWRSYCWDTAILSLLKYSNIATMSPNDSVAVRWSNDLKI